MEVRFPYQVAMHGLYGLTRIAFAMGKADRSVRMPQQEPDQFAPGVAGGTYNACFNWFTHGYSR
jgi:hypothetical protein